ncbi:hypothetical protein FQA39_LY13402 [Lamprigera yunnana]|nr:hypothetical protein FQA39_LY13402 [Lamprigera yunnana]
MRKPDHSDVQIVLLSTIHENVEKMISIEAIHDNSNTITELAVITKVTALVPVCHNNEELELTNEVIIQDSVPYTVADDLFSQEISVPDNISQNQNESNQNEDQTMPENAKTINEIPVCSEDGILILHLNPAVQNEPEFTKRVNICNGTEIEEREKVDEEDETEHEKNRLETKEPTQEEDTKIKRVNDKFSSLSNGVIDCSINNDNREDTVFTYIENGNLPDISATSGEFSELYIEPEESQELLDFTGCRIVDIEYLFKSLQYSKHEDDPAKEQLDVTTAAVSGS